MQTRPADRSSGDDHGWCFGLPPGIAANQWPLDPHNGYPLMHGFTLLLPPEYRVHGPDIVALSFFACAPDHNDGCEDSIDEITALFEDAPGVAPTDPDLLPFWESIQASHPHLHRMKDDLDCSYAVILLTQEEYDGPLCMPPACAHNALRKQIKAPAWLAQGSALSFWEREYSQSSSLKPEEYMIYRVLGQIPNVDIAFQRALRWSPRSADPNAGVAVRSPNYQNHFYWQNDKVERANYREHEWAANHRPNHIGGTTRPIQDTPEMSAYHIGFEEYFGGYNFGSGNAQLDFKEMKLYWAC